MRLRVPVSLLFLIVFVSTGRLEASLSVDDLFETYFPQVTRGTKGIYIETRITIVNPSSEPVDVTLESFGVELTETSVALEGHQSAEIVFEGEPFEAGWVRLSSPQVVSASARMITKPSQDSAEILGSTSILGQSPTSRVTIPVRLNGLEAENTGFAIAYIQDGRFRFTLFDASGMEIASREEVRGFTLTGNLSDYAAMFVTELFPDLPAGLTRGSLLIEHVLPEKIAVAFAVTAIYTQGTRLIAGEVTGIDDSRKYGAFLLSAENPVATAEILAATYGFEIGEMLSEAFVGLMTHEKARALARDSRVQAVYAISAGPVCQFACP